jgi:hypothetical protein
MSDPQVDEQLQEALALNAQLKEMQSIMSHVEPSKRRPSGGSGRGVGGYGGRTFTSGQEQEIQRQNAHLVNKLARVRGEVNTTVYRPQAPAPAREGHASINRRKKATEIERENAVRASLAQTYAMRRVANVSHPPRLRVRPPCVFARGLQRIVARIQGQKSKLSNMKPPPSKPKQTSSQFGSAGRGGVGYY